jgi:hypothetical protein
MLIDDEPKLRLVTNSDIKMSLDFMLALELATNRLREASAILTTINETDLLAVVPSGADGSAQKIAVSLLCVLERELHAIIELQERIVEQPRPSSIQAE